MTRTLLQLRDLGRTFPSGNGRVAVLRDINLAIPAGQFLAIVGPSGSGKSTLMNILGCLDRPSSGTYLANGVDVASLTPDAVAELRRTTFSFVFERDNLMSGLSALENVAVPAVYAGSHQSARLARAATLLGHLGLADRLHHRPGQLSGGQQRRVSIARALMNGASVILADEPTGALDSRNGEEVMDTLHALHGDGHTIVLITHDPELAQHAERIVRLADGRVVADETTRHRRAEGSGSTSGRAETGAVFWEALKMALRSLVHNRLRTALTVLVIIIGAASVVATLAIVNGAKQGVLQRIQAMGNDLLAIKHGLRNRPL